MPVKEADPQAKELEAAFAEAMSGPSKPRDVPPPPEVDREAPHGRDEDGKPLAPFGYNKDGSVKKTTAGRKPKDDQARIAPPAQPGAAEAGSGAVPPTPPADLLGELVSASEGIWLLGTMAADAGPRLPLVGRLIPGRKLSATMAAFDSQRPALAAALDEAARHNARARALAVKLASGDMAWAVTVVSLIMPFASAMGAIWQGDKALAEQGLPGLDELARRNEAAMEAWLERAAQAALAAQAQVPQMAAANGQVTGDG